MFPLMSFLDQGPALHSVVLTPEPSPWGQVLSLCLLSSISQDLDTFFFLNLNSI